jgi:D-inositol-3-phosphate glycosyltransferase
MRIAVTSYSAGPDDGRSAAGLAGALADHGHQVTLIARRRHLRPATEPPPEDPTMRIRSLRPGPATHLTEDDGVAHLDQLIHALERQLRGPFDVVHSHGWLAGLGTQLALRSRTGQRPAVVHTIARPLLAPGTAPAADEQDRPGGSPGRRRTDTEHAVARHADHLITTHEPLSDELVATGVPRRRITVVPPGVTGSGPPSTTQGRRAGTPYHVCVTGGSHRRGDLDFPDLARTLSRLPDTRVTVCGTAADPLTPEQARLATTLGLGVITESDSTARRLDLVRSADLVVSAEESGFLHLEALCAGTPVVALSPLATEAVVDRVCGVHAMGATPRRFLLLVGELLANPTTRQAMSVAGQDRVRNRYTWTRVATETTRVYEHAAPARQTS